MRALATMFAYGVLAVNIPALLGGICMLPLTVVFFVCCARAVKSAVDTLLYRGTPWHWRFCSPVIVVALITLAESVSSMSSQLANSLAWERPTRQGAMEESAAMSGAAGNALGTLCFGYQGAALGIAALSWMRWHCTTQAACRAASALAMCLLLRGRVPQDALALAVVMAWACPSFPPPGVQRRAAPVPPDLYFERQVRALCAVHSLNNCIGAAFFTQQHLEDAVNTLRFEAQFPDAPNVPAAPFQEELHRAPGGWYSELAMITALTGTPFHWGVTVTAENLDFFSAPFVVGILVNVRNEHWIAIRRWRGASWLLDSQLAPRELLRAELLAFLGLHPHAYYLMRAGEAPQAPAAAVPRAPAAAPLLDAGSSVKRRRRSSRPAGEAAVATAGDAERESRPRATSRLAVASPRRQYQGEACRGQPGRPCIFSHCAPLQPARVQPARKRTRCLFCDAALLRELHHKQPRLVTLALTRVTAANAEALPAARAFLQEHLGDPAECSYFARAQAAGLRRAPAPQAELPSIASSWTEALRSRRSVLPRPLQQHRDSYPSWLRNDEHLRDRKFPNIFAETDAKRSWMTPLARHFEQWAQYASWALCKSCGRLEHRQFAPVDVRRPQKRRPHIEKCRFCQRGVGYRSPAWDDIPKVLRELTEEALDALRPLDPDVGPYEREPHGYRVHTEMIRFRWRPQGVIEQISLLRGKHYRKAEAAFKWLMENGPDESFRSSSAFQDFFAQHPEMSAYRAFVLLHDQFLARNEQAPAPLVGAPPRHRLPVSFLETVGLECAVWPHLYPRAMRLFDSLSQKTCADFAPASSLRPFALDVFS